MRRFFGSYFDDDEPPPVLPELPLEHEVADPTIKQLVAIIKVQDARYSRLQRAYERFGVRMVRAWVIVVAGLVLALAIGGIAFFGLGDKQNQLNAQAAQTSRLSKENARVINLIQDERTRNTTKLCVHDDRANAVFVGFLAALIPPAQARSPGAQKFLALANKTFPSITHGTSVADTKKRQTYCAKQTVKKVKPVKIRTAK